ncbi:MAG: tRNA (N(6)-L-threonylcarbamoyladenosine(37)-C(2))-methylthiotransferase MtaB [Oscillospiraceae bacterium]|nr:tRNA (N(6)-L-threonylcarbamoyladenosine(37)-C(2))-methylthiotransferase MtaB [Oscillospiraceae bacterium]
MKIYVETLGCKVNQFESQAMEALLRQKGHEIVLSPEGCDGVILNSCAVTAESERKSRQALRRLMGEAPEAVYAVCGCWTQLRPEAGEALGAHVVAGSCGHETLISDLEAAYAEKKKTLHHDEALKRRVFEPLPAGRLEGRTRALLKIQDGCSNFCTYCVIPYTRGPSRSLPPEACAEGAKAIAEQGVQEIVITGIEVASYGRDLRPKCTLADAVEAVAKAAPEARLRLGSLEPRVVTEEFCRRLAALPGICPHFHLSLQSGCDATLQRMHRRYTAREFYDAAELLRKYFPGCAIGADLITGFPGETEEEFSATLAFLEKVNFSFLHVFPYSQRPGTPADSMPGQVPKAEKKARAQRAIAVAEKLTRRYLEAQVGKTLSVLLETEKDGLWQGHGKNYCEVAVKGQGARNLVANVQIIGVKNGKLDGIILL